MTDKEKNIAITLTAVAIIFWPYLLRGLYNILPDPEFVRLSATALATAISTVGFAGLIAFLFLDWT